MFLSGIADEAGKDLWTQIRAHKDLGWSHIEIRNVGGTQFTDIPDAEFDEACRSLDEAGIEVSCFASAIANWATRITDPVEKSLDVLERAMPRMKRLGCRFIRTMSWPNDGLPVDEWRDECVRKMKRLAARAEDEGVVLVVENCSGWASESAADYARFFELVGLPAVKAVYDTGNPASHGHADTWQWYLAAKPHIVYVHIKSHTAPDPSGEPGRHVWPEEGAGMVLETLKDLFAGGYDGGVSIEPHLGSIIHLGREMTDAESAYLTYVEYGRRAARLVDLARADLEMEK